MIEPRSEHLRVLLLTVAISPVAGLLGSCDEPARPTPYFPNPHGHQPGAVARGCTLYAANCLDCHGTIGHGDGIHKEHLNPPPSDLMSRASRGRGNQFYFERVAFGGTAPSGMPAFSELLTDQEIWETIAYVSHLSTGHDGDCSSLPGDDAADDAADDGQSSDGDQDTGNADSGGVSEEGPADDADTGPVDDEAGSEDGPMTTVDPSTDDGGPSPACAELCGCLDTYCPGIAGYPFSSEADCLTQCEGFSTDETACWQGFCDDIANSPGLADHLCEHAWGGLGLAEC